jgi:hypothetical protein
LKLGVAARKKDEDIASKKKVRIQSNYSMDES